MQSHLITFLMSLPATSSGEVPQWLHVMPAGTFVGKDGRGPFRLLNAAQVIATSMADGKLALDENHSIDLAAPKGEPSPARGWIVEMQAREDGIWARVEWTEAGTQIMARKEYSGISPVFQAGKDGAVARILRASLTNNPNLTDLHTLHHRQEDSMDLSKLRQALGLGDSADEGAILAAAETNTRAAQAHAQQIKAIVAAAGAKATDADGLVTELQARQSAGNDVSALTTKIVGLETELMSVRNEQARTRAVAFIDGAIADGKALNSLRDHYITRHMAEPEAVEKEVGAMKSIHAAGTGRTRASMNNSEGGGEDELTQEEMAVCEKMGQDPKKLLEFRKKKGA